LITLRSLPVFYYRPTTTSTKTREDFGIPRDATIYGCLQALFKFHPDFDALLAGVLRRDPAGRIVITGGVTRQWDAKLLARFARTIPDVVDRIHFVPPQPFQDFLRLTSLCDVML